MKRSLFHAKLPYWRLSFFYLAYFGFLGAWVPYWTLYLSDSLKFAADEIGVVMGVSMATRIIGPYFWGQLADKLSRRLFVIRLGALLALISFLGLWLSQSFFWVCGVVAVFSLFWNAILSQFEALTLEYLDTHSHWYSYIRLWGSVGFIMVVLGAGFWLDLSQNDQLLLAMLTILMFLILSSTVCVSEPLTASYSGKIKNNNRAKFEGSAKDKKPGFIDQVKQWPVLAMFVIFFLVQFSFGSFYTFFTIYLEAFDYSKTTIAWLWSLGVIAEVFMFLVMAKLFRSFSLYLLLQLTLCLTCLRWALLALYPENLSILIVVQLLHAVSFASMHAITMQWLRHSFDNTLQGRAQAFYSATSYGVGGMLGALVSGFAWDFLQGGIFWLASIAVFLAVILCFQIRESLNNLIADT